MLRLPPFEYQPARSGEEAAALLARYGADALPVAGGTDLYANMKQRLFTPKVLVGLRPITDLHFIAYNEYTGLTLGALATLTHISESEVVRKYYPALAHAASVISTPQLRNVGTIGGNVCLDTRCNYYNQNLDWRKALDFCMKKDGDICRVAPGSPKCVAINSSDTAPVLQTYGARVVLTGPSGTREIDIADFFLNDGMQAWAKRSDEIVTKIAVPPPETGARIAYRKLRLRNSFDFPILGVAAMVVLDPLGVCRSARLVLNAVAPKPMEVPEAARALLGSKLEPEAIAAAADAAFAMGRPLDNASATIPYRKRMVRVFAQRVLEDIVHAHPSLQ
jgi:4-hydroxybenzoyl-CoA reductase subunit beta